MSTLVRRLESSDVRMSAQRRIIAECLDGDDRHVTADDLLATSQARLPEIGRATVYKALSAFVDAGIVREIRVSDGPILFDPNAHIAHDHLVCEQCGGVWDVVNESPELPAGSEFDVNRTETNYFGICSNCAA